MNILDNSTKLFQMEDEEYFGNGLPGYISNSRMSLINPAEGGSRHKYLNGFDKKTDSMALGSAVHQLILESERYELAEVDVPSDSTKKIIDTVYKLVNREDNPLEFMDALKMSIQLHNYYKGNPGDKRTESLIKNTQKYYNFLCGDKHHEGMIYLTTDMKMKCTNAIDAVYKNVDAMRLLLPTQTMADAHDDIESYNEHVMTCSINFKGQVYHLKLKMDNFSVNHTKKIVKLNDLKTSAFKTDMFMGIWGVELEGFELVKKYFKGSFQKYHYYRQMYMYSTILRKWISETYGADYDFECNMIVVETVPFKPECKVVSVSEEWLEIGKLEFLELMGHIHAIDNASTDLDDLEIDNDSFEDEGNDLDELSVDENDLYVEME